MRSLSEYRNIVWDFNGTLLDDLGIGIRAVNALLLRRGLRPLASPEEYHAVFCFPIEEYYRRLGFDFSREPYEVLAVEWVNEYRAIEHTAPLREGASELISLFAGRGLRQIVLSATEAGMLREQLSALGILESFDTVLGRSDIYAESKLALAEALAPSLEGRTLVIGDTSHDLEMAQILSADAVLLRGGHTSDAALKALGCEVADGLTELGRRLTDADG